VAERRRALIVEDDAIVRGTVVEALAMDGWEVRTASDGADALAVLAGWVPDVITLDLMMPGMDGWAFRAEQRRRPELAGVPVVVLSASRWLAAATEALAPAAALAKPFDLDELLGTLERCADQGAPVD
jgi:two-component system, chemotaxis family, chemotaxis protein CheY